MKGLQLGDSIASVLGCMVPQYDREKKDVEVHIRSAVGDLELHKMSSCCSGGFPESLPIIFNFSYLSFFAHS